MNRAARLQPILEEAERRERDAAAVLAACRERHGAQAERLAQLLRYRGEYAGSLSARGAEGMAVRELRDYGSFLNRLGEAVEAESRTLSRLDAELAACLETWRAAVTRARSLAKAVERERAAWLRLQQRREQAVADERASQSGTAGPFR